MGDVRILDPEGLQGLIDALASRGYDVLGPTLRDGAIVPGPVRTLDDLPRGWGDEQDAAHYRLRRRDDDALFGFAAGAQSPKSVFFPADELIWRGRRTGAVVTVDERGPSPADDDGAQAAPGEPVRPVALAGVRSCDLHALAIHDTMLTRRNHVDVRYAARRAGTFVVAVTCSVSRPRRSPWAARAHRAGRSCSPGSLPAQRPRILRPRRVPPAARAGQRGRGRRRPAPARPWLRGCLALPRAHRGGERHRRPAGRPCGRGVLGGQRPARPGPGGDDGSVARGTVPGPRGDVLAAARRHLPGAQPHHSFHVFGVYPWLGLLRAGRLEEPLRVLDRCRIRWGEVVDLVGDRALVRCRPLEWDGRVLAEGAPRVEQVAVATDGLGLAGPLAPGDWCSMHWDWVCERLDRHRLLELRFRSARQLALVNAQPFSAPASVLA